MPSMENDVTGLAARPVSPSFAVVDVSPRAIPGKDASCAVYPVGRICIFPVEMYNSDEKPISANA